ncbi:MAG: hypothetical protein VKJ09_11545 [Leptolyngbya sp.]|nr:hypothetical protein [Leptolyngbya sp.]
MTRSITNGAIIPRPLNEESGKGLGINSQGGDQREPSAGPGAIALPLELMRSHRRTRGLSPLPQGNAENLRSRCVSPAAPNSGASPGSCPWGRLTRMIALDKRSP